MHEDDTAHLILPPSDLLTEADRRWLRGLSSNGLGP